MFTLFFKSVYLFFIYSVKVFKVININFLFDFHLLFPIQIQGRNINFCFMINSK